jgi:hypothetical protein
MGLPFWSLRPVNYIDTDWLADREALVRLRVDQGGRAEDVDALIRLADEAAAKGLPAGPLTNKSVPEHRLVGVSCG